MKYINDQGRVIDALQYDGSKEVAREIENKFGVVFVNKNDEVFIPAQQWVETFEQSDYIFEED